MGGIGSGAQRSTHIGNVEDMLALDIRILRRLDVVIPGECVINTLHWSIGGHEAPSVRIRTDLSDIERGGEMTITGPMPDGPIKQKLAIEMVLSDFGGHRCYFICPFTSRRCELLYYARGRFASREAQHLSYAVQGMTDLARARRKAMKLHRRLSGQSRPRGANRIEREERLQEARSAAKALYTDRLRTHRNRSGSQRIPSNRK